MFSLFTIAVVLYPFLFSITIFMTTVLLIMINAFLQSPVACSFSHHYFVHFFNASSILNNSFLSLVNSKILLSDVIDHKHQTDRKKHVQYSHNIRELRLKISCHYHASKPTSRGQNPSPLVRIKTKRCQGGCLICFVDLNHYTSLS